MEIRSIKIDFDKDILEVNGKKVEKPVTVTLPGPDGWPIQKMFNPEVKPYEEYGRINIEVDKTDKTIKGQKISETVRESQFVGRGIGFQRD